MKQAPVLSERDKQRVLQSLHRHSYPARNRCMLMLSWLAGMRAAEIAALRIGDVLDGEGGVRTEIMLKPQQTKGSKARTVLVNTQLRGELASYISTCNHSDPSIALITSKTAKPLSPNGLCQVMLHIYDKAGLDKATSHSGRRTFITDLAHKGVNVRVLAALAGHAGIATTQKYIDLNENVMRAAVELV